MRRAVIYLRVSTLDQTTANQERELRESADRMGCEIVMGLQGSRHQRYQGPRYVASCTASSLLPETLSYTVLGKLERTCRGGRGWNGRSGRSGAATDPKR